MFVCFYLDLHGGHIEAPLRHSPLRASFFHFLEYFHSQRLDFESDSFKFYNSVILRHICVRIFLLLFIIIIACSSLLQAYRMSTRERISERRQCNEDQAQINTLDQGWTNSTILHRTFHVGSKVQKCNIVSLYISMSIVSSQLGGALAVVQLSKTQ